MESGAKNLKKICYFLIGFAVVFVSFVLISELIMNELTVDSLMVSLISYFILIFALVPMTKMGE